MLLEVAGLSKRFGGITALADVTLSVKHGEIVGLIGPNGAGKTTFFHVLSGFLRPEVGSARFLGSDLLRLEPHRICRLGLARTFQLVQPFGQMTVLDNVAAGYLFGRVGGRASVGRARAEAERILDLVGFGGSPAQPAGALNLPGRKRLELARALATGPRLLCLDEVMGGLAPAELALMAEMVGRINQDLGVGILMTEHNVRWIARTCRRIVVLNYGQVIADGPPDRVMQDPEVVAAYLGDRRRDGMPRA